MSKRVNIHVGTLDDMGKRFVSAWHRLERGERPSTLRLIRPPSDSRRCRNLPAYCRSSGSDTAREWAWTRPRKLVVRRSQSLLRRREHLVSTPKYLVYAAAHV
jgi:hypothetical protein